MPHFKTNRLANEKSPYLLQHMHNPVEWYSWGEEAFAAARAADKPIFLSIGYATCYWCHVMEKDSFERDDVAEVLNRDFIAIKLDREERPDIDQIYMDAVVGLTGHGGWPMSVFLTPDLKPFWGGTFFYRDQFISVLEQLSHAWHTQREKVLTSATSITDALKERELKGSAALDIEATYTRLVRELGENFDPEHGGFGGAPKFPQAAILSLLLRIHTATGNPEALRMAEVTLRGMAYGGIYDHLGGGFSRYSTDEKWSVPHFEKMLYDNALLTVTYLEAHQVTGTEWYKAIARETLDYLFNEMKGEHGAFYSAQDAGEVGREGEFYVWKMEELRRILDGGALQVLKDVYRVTDTGNFEHGANVLTLNPEQTWDVKRELRVKDLHRTLLATRQRRTPPITDDKVLTAWNGLAITALCKGYQILGDKKYLKAAQNCALFLKENLVEKGVLLRRYRDKESRFSGCLDDYSYLIEGLINLYESDFCPDWYEWALALQQAQDDNLWDSEYKGYRFTVAPEVVVRKKDYLDNATPSGNSVSLNNLVRLFALSGEGIFRERSLELGNALSSLIERYPTAVAKAIHALPMLLGKGSMIAVIGGKIDSENTSVETEGIVSLIHQSFHPNSVVAASIRGEGPGDFSDLKENGRLPLLLKGRISPGGLPEVGEAAAVYICRDQLCDAPEVSTEGLRLKLQLLR